jgi:hypothetical protein
MLVLSFEGSDTGLTVSLPLRVKVDLRGLDFKGLVQAIGEAATAACSELLGWMVRAVERRAMEAQPDRWVNRGQQTRRVQVSWGTVAIRRTRVRDRITGATYSGVIEKTLALSLEGIETQINRRMKRQGMSWSIRGARRLGKLRVLYREERRWDAFWSQMWSDLPEAKRAGME